MKNQLQGLCDSRLNKLLTIAEQQKQVSRVRFETRQFQLIMGSGAGLCVANGCLYFPLENKIYLTFDDVSRLQVVGYESVLLFANCLALAEHEAGASVCN